jgi:hypothetical protein
MTIYFLQPFLETRPLGSKETHLFKEGGFAAAAPALASEAGSIDRYHRRHLSKFLGFSGQAGKTG